MKEINANDEKFAVTFKEKRYELTYATVQQSKDYDEREKDDAKKDDAVFLLLEDVGLSREIAMQMQNRSLLAIVEELVSIKK